MNYKCHCGKTHKIDTKKPGWAAFIKFIDDYPPNIPVTIGDGTWIVPRMYIAIHGLKGKELSLLGFPKISR